MKSPCATCPFRKSAPVGMWHPDEFLNLIRRDRSEFGGSLFRCHQANGELCMGWLIDQKRRGEPCHLLRVTRVADPAAQAAFDRADVDEPDLYPSLMAMVQAQVDKRFPKNNPLAVRLKRKKERRQ